MRRRGAGVGAWAVRPALSLVAGAPGAEPGPARMA